MHHNKLWKILQEMGILDHLTCLLRNLYAGQGASVRIGHGTTDWFQIGKRVHQDYILLPSYLTSMQRTSCEMPGWMRHKLESRLPGRGAVLRWQRNRTGRPLSPSQIHQKNISTLSKLHKTTSGCWQRTSGTQKSRSLS